MRKIGASSTLTVYHDGQFWVGTFERVGDGKLSACRVVFGAEPSSEEILETICKRWNRLRFSAPIASSAPPKAAANPKRRQREAARELRQRGPSTKAQQALAEQCKAEGRERREQERQERFERHREKRKQKHRGR